MRVKNIWLLFFFLILSINSLAENTPLKKEILLKSADVRPAKRSVPLSPHQIATVVLLDNQLNFSFHLPIGWVQISIYSDGMLISQDWYDVSSANVFIPIYLNSFEDEQSRVEIRMENGYLYGVF